MKQQYKPVRFVMSIKDAFNNFRHSENFWISLLRDILVVFLAVAIFASFSQIVFGMWTPMVAVESGSMEPNIHIGDIIFVEDIDRTQIKTHKTSNDYTSFGNEGDVILYQPYGRDSVTPVIHRAMYFVEEGEPMWNGGPPAPYSGYITKGDNPNTNTHFDQQGSISYHRPVKDEWVIGVARYRVPYIGYLRLIVPV